MSRHSTVARIAAPVAFLVAVTIAVLLVRAALDSSDQPTATTVAVAQPTPRFHVVVRGDTFASIARRYGTPVQVIRDLNPGIDPVSLEVGSRIRVR